MKVAVFSSKRYDVKYLKEHKKFEEMQLDFIEARLSHETALLTQGYDGIVVFVNDLLDEPVLKAAAENGVKHIALRCAGFNNIDLDAAKKVGISVSRVPGYSPEAVAEHTVALMLTLNRKLHKAYNRIRENNFMLDGLMGFNMHGKTVGIVGTGKIGQITIKILQGLGCNILCFDPYPIKELEEQGAKYVEFDELLASADIISLHCPLLPSTEKIINADAVSKMKPGVMLINTSRGGLIDTQAVIEGLKNYQIGNLGLDVYEMEGDLFFRDLSDTIVQDDIFMRLLTFPNVLITGHQGFFTDDAMKQIAQTTLNNLHLAFHGKSDERTFLVDC